MVKKMILVLYITEVKLFLIHLGRNMQLTNLCQVEKKKEGQRNRISVLRRQNEWEKREVRVLRRISFEKML